MDNAGAFSAGKSIRKKTALTLSGQCLSTVALPTVGTGAASPTVPHVDSSDLPDKNEGAADFSVAAHYFEAGVGDFV